METEDDVDLHEPYVGLELSKDVKTTQIEGVVKPHSSNVFRQYRSGSFVQCQLRGAIRECGAKYFTTRQQTQEKHEGFDFFFKFLPLGG